MLYPILSQNLFVVYLVLRIPNTSHTEKLMLFKHFIATTLSFATQLSLLDYKITLVDRLLVRISFGELLSQKFQVLHKITRLTPSLLSRQQVFLNF